MTSALGHCEDTACSQLSSNREPTRLFHCSIHCDRRLCLDHLNAHNVLYEEEKQYKAALNKLQGDLTSYQAIFTQHLQEYTQLVNQASAALSHNTTAKVPVEQVRSISEKIERAIAVFNKKSDASQK